ncbi:MAG TPA: hypothetical protein VKB34_07125, partial [Povalibacter sp.]|nr:hypothetical protein [Povalibacter sp.]
DAEAAVSSYRPADPAAVVLRLGDAGGEQRLARLRAASDRAPGDVDTRLRYVDALIETGARSGNERYYGYAEQSLGDARIAPTPTTLLRQAQLLQHRHAFREAEQVLGRLLDRDPRDREARLMRAQVRLHLHEPQQSATDCAALASLVDMLTTTTCVAQARAASGDLERAYALVTATLQSQQAEPATRSWSAGVAAELAARLGNTKAADRWYEEAFRLHPQDHYVRITYADWLMAQGRNDAAVDVASRGASMADRARVVLARRDLQSDESRRLQLAWREAATRGDRGYLREQTRFELTVRHDATTAHVLAQQNFHERTEPEDALLLATTAVATGDRAALATVRTWRERYRYRDVRLDRLLGDAS